MPQERQPALVRRNALDNLTNIAEPGPNGGSAAMLKSRTTLGMLVVALAAATVFANG